MSQEITHEKAVEIDTELAELWAQEDAAKTRISQWKDSLASAIGLERKRGSNGYRYYSETLPEIIEMAEQKLAAGSLLGYDKSLAERALQSIAEAKHQIAKAREAAKPGEDLYDEHQWSRFFIVTNNNGHIHSSMRCTTCYQDTRFAWLPALSGLDEAAAVEDQGEILCSVCYPSAPVAWTNGTSKASQAEKAERAAAKAARDAKKAAKAIYDLDGSVLKDDMGFEIKTEVTARRELSNALQNEYLGYDGGFGGKFTLYAERLAAAIANKTGESAQELLETGRVKAKKKIDKEWSR